MVGGNVNVGAESRDSPAADAWRRGAAGAPPGPGHPRWVEILLFAMTLILCGTIVTMLVLVATH